MSDTMIWLLAALGVELVLLVLVLLLVSWARHRAARRRDLKAMQALAARVRKGRGDREAVLQAFLARSLGLEGDALSNATAGLWRAEVAMMKQFIRVYRDRDANAAAQFDTSLAAAVAAYHELQSTGVSDGQSDGGESVDIAELEPLRAENKRLSDELKITMETMSRMLNEYSTMFSGAAPGDTTPVTVGSGASASGQAGAEMPTSPAQGQDDEVSVVVDGVGMAAEDETVTEPEPDPEALIGQEEGSRQSAEPEESVAEPVDDQAAIDELLGNAQTDAPETMVDAESDNDDASLRQELGSAADERKADKGADLEAVSDLLITGEAELVQADGAEVQDDGAAARLDGDGGPTEKTDRPPSGAASVLVDQDDIDSLFDGDGVESTEDRPDPKDAAVSQHEIDDLFDADEPDSRAPESAQR